MGFDIGWILTILSLCGTYFVVKKNVLGQWIWTVANSSWCLYHFYYANYSSCALFGAYLALSIWGAISWGREAKEQAA